MFDIGFWELSIIGVVALIVIGPDKLPSVARTAGKWFGKANRFISTVKEDITKEIKNEDLQNILKQQEELANEFKQVAQDAKDSVGNIDTTLGQDDLIEFSDSSNQPLAKKKKKKNKSSKEAKKLKQEKKSKKKALQEEAIAQETIPETIKQKVTVESGP